MEPEFIAAIGTAVGLGVGGIIAATAKAVKSSSKRSSRPPATDLPPKVLVALQHIDELRSFARDESIERVHQAESRRVILKTADVLEALVLGMDRDRVEIRAAFRDARDERDKHAEKLVKTLREVADLVQNSRDRV